MALSSKPFQHTAVQTLVSDDPRLGLGQADSELLLSYLTVPSPRLLVDLFWRAMAARLFLSIHVEFRFGL